MKVVHKVLDLVHKHCIWDGYVFFWRDKEDEGRGLPPLQKEQLECMELLD